MVWCPRWPSWTLGISVSYLCFFFSLSFFSSILLWIIFYLDVLLSSFTLIYMRFKRMLRQGYIPQESEDEEINEHLPNPRAACWTTKDFIAHGITVMGGNPCLSYVHHKQRQTTEMKTVITGKRVNIIKAIAKREKHILPKKGLKSLYTNRQTYIGRPHTYKKETENNKNTNTRTLTNTSRKWTHIKAQKKE